MGKFSTYIVSPPVELTYAELNSLVGSNALVQGRHYIISDYNKGTVGAAKILLHAVSTNELSRNVDINTSFDDTSWQGVYDFPSNAIIELYDHLGNKVIGESSVDTFPWGNSAVTGNYIENSTLNGTLGLIRNNTITGNSTVTINNANLYESVIEGSSTLNVVAGGGGGGSITAIHVEGSSVITKLGQNSIGRSIFQNKSNITIGSISIANCKFNNAVLDTTGSSGHFYYSDFKNVILPNLQNVTSFIVERCDFSSNVVFNISGASLCLLLNNSFTTTSVLNISAGKQFYALNSSFKTGATINVTDGKITINSSTISDATVIQQNSTGVNNQVSRSFLSKAKVTYNNDSDYNDIGNCSLTSDAFIKVDGGKLKLISSDLDTLAYVMCDSVNTYTKIQYGKLSSNSFIRVSGCTAYQWFLSPTCISQSGLRATDNTIDVQFLYLNTSSLAQFRVRNCTNPGTAILRYSSASDGSEAYITLDNHNARKLSMRGGAYYNGTNPTASSNWKNF